MKNFLNFSASDLLQKRKRLRREWSAVPALQNIRIAVLGGSTTSEVIDLLELFLLSSGFQPVFYQGEYGRYYEESTLDPEKIKDFKPDFIYIHTHYRDVRHKPELADSADAVEEKLGSEVARFRHIWFTLHDVVGCQIIQNNFETAPLQSMGNLDAVARVGFNRFLLELNLEFSRVACQERWLSINDVHSLAATLGLTHWFDWNRWFSYKIVTTPDGSALLAESVASIIGAARGKAKKCLVLDLDNTLWGGIIGDDGADKIQIGSETAVSEAYSAFQAYCLGLRERGIVLAVCSKNEEAVARSGFSHPDSLLKLEHFSAFKANWNPKSENIAAIAEELNLGLDSFVFIDDNPAERAIVAAQLPLVAVPDVGSDVSHYPAIIQSHRYFEVTSFSAEDLARAEQYAANSARASVQSKFANYGEYLASLKMVAEIDSFRPVYLERITQLINKSNQFNLTTRRYTYAEVEEISNDPQYITVYGRLSDVFGDNGLVSVIIGKQEHARLQLDLWIMSCRVLKRDMELAMLDAVVEQARVRGVQQIIGLYKPTAKNVMVKDHYSALGFDLVLADSESGETVWSLDTDQYQARNRHIEVAKSELTASSELSVASYS